MGWEKVEVKREDLTRAQMRRRVCLKRSFTGHLLSGDTCSLPLCSKEKKFSKALGVVRFTTAALVNHTWKENRITSVHKSLQQAR